MKSHVWFVVVAYQPDNELLRRLVAVLKEWPVVVVDNSQYQISNIKYQVDKANSKYLKTGENIGYAGGANAGMKVAFENGAIWTVVLNQDIRLTREGITQFCAIARTCAPGVIGPEGGSLDRKRWTTILEFHKATPCPSASLRVNSQGIGLEKPEYISGSMMAIHKDVWQSVGGFYEPYFMYYEDADLSVRARNAGFPVRKIPIPGFQHESHGSNETDEQDERKRKQKAYYLARNHLWFVLRLAPRRIKMYELLRLPKTFIEYAYDHRR